MKKLLEKDLQTQIMVWLRLNDFFCFKVNNVGIKKMDGSYIPVGMRGIADIHAIKYGKAIWIECKIKGNKLSPFQKQFLDNVARSGGIAFCAYSLEEVINVLG